MSDNGGLPDNARGRMLQALSHDITRLDLALKDVLNDNDRLILTMASAQLMGYADLWTYLQDALEYPSPHNAKQFSLAVGRVQASLMFGVGFYAEMITGKENPDAPVASENGTGSSGNHPAPRG